MSWALLGIILLVVSAAAALGAISGILVPLVIAVIIGTLLEPVTRGLRKVRIPAPLAAVIGLLLVAVIAVGVAVVVVAGFVRQLPEISKQLVAGWEAIVAWVKSLSLDPEVLERVRVAVSEYAPDIGLGALGLVSHTVLGMVSLSIGVFFALFFLFFVVKDHDLFPQMLARLLRVDADVVIEVDRISQGSLRDYFRGVALTALITAPVFVIPLLVMRVPLVIPIFILYFLLSFIPYIGAWITAAFAVLIAFGSGGLTAAIVVTVSLLVSNGTVQSVVNSWVLGASLKMHPMAVLLATVIGGTVAGMLGMVLAPPLLAAIRTTTSALRSRRGAADVPSPPGE